MNAKLDAAKREHDAKNNARITRNNAGVRGARVESRAAYVLYLRELHPDRERNQKNHLPLLVNKLVNSYHPLQVANPGPSRLLGGTHFHPHGHPSGTLDGRPSGAAKFGQSGAVLAQ
jgi:hypothetical protein